jgi:hypothetical protein
MGLVSKRKHCGSGRSPRWLTEQNPRAGSEAPSGRRLGILLYAEKQLTKDDRVGKGGGKDRGMAIKPRKKTTTKWRYFVHPPVHLVEQKPIQITLTVAANKICAIDEWLEKYGPLTLDRIGSRTTTAKKQKRK